MGASVVIVQNHGSTDYLLYTIASGWRRRGIDSRQHVGPDDIPAADLVILHVDLSVVPDAYRSALAEVPLVLNRRAVDIRRPGYSTQIVTRDSDWDGPVIVKTVSNYGGIPEESDRRGRRSLRRGRWDWATARTLDPRRYPTFSAIDRVPGGVWDNPWLVVERFLPEREDDLHFVRYWLFLGDRSMTGRLGSPDPVVKFSTMVCDTGPCEPPADLVALRSRLGLDYGRFDYTVHDGETFVFDANRTMGGGPAVQHHLDTYHDVGRGIDGLLSGQVRPLGG